MKTVKYKGLVYDVPERTRFMATDENGEVYAYQERPVVEDNIWWIPDGRGMLGCNCNHVYPEDWEDSLVEIEE